MSKRIRFLKAIEGLWGVLAGVLFIISITNFFSAAAGTKDHFLLMGLTVVSFIMYTFRKNYRKRMERMGNDNKNG